MGSVGWDSNKPTPAAALLVHIRRLLSKQKETEHPVGKTQNTWH